MGLYSLFIGAEVSQGAQFKIVENFSSAWPPISEETRSKYPIVAKD